MGLGDYSPYAGQGPSPVQQEVTQSLTQSLPALGQALRGSMGLSPVVKKYLEAALNGHMDPNVAAAHAKLEMSGQHPDLQPGVQPVMPAGGLGHNPVPGAATPVSEQYSRETTQGMGPQQAPQPSPQQSAQTGLQMSPSAPGMQGAQGLGMDLSGATRQDMEDIAALAPLVRGLRGDTPEDKLLRAQLAAAAADIRSQRSAATQREVAGTQAEAGQKRVETQVAGAEKRAGAAEAGKNARQAKDLQYKYYALQQHISAMLAISRDRGLNSQEIARAKIYSDQIKSQRSAVAKELTGLTKLTGDSDVTQSLRDLDAQMKQAQTALDDSIARSRAESPAAPESTSVTTKTTGQAAQGSVPSPADLLRNSYLFGQQTAPKPKGQPAPAPQSGKSRLRSLFGLGD